MKKILFLSFIFVAGLISSCTNDWFEIKPKGQGSPATLTSKTGIEYLLTGTYAVVDGTHLPTDGAVWASAVSNWVWGSVASDDAYKGSDYGDQATINPVEAFTADADNGYVANHWQGLFDGVIRANDVLRYLPETEDMNETEKLQAEAQAKFLRAHFYVELTMVHGKVPYIDENTETPKTVANDHLLWPEIETDMKFAVSNLPESWNEVGRATKWAAKTYLARIYLLQGKYSEALPLLDDVYTNGPFELMESYEQNYLIEFNNNKESIFEIQYATNDGASGSPNGGWGDALNFPHGVAGMGTCCGFFQPTHSLVSAYRVGDDGLPLLDDTYSADDMLPYDTDITKGEDVMYDGLVDPRLDHTVGRPGIPFLDWGIHVGYGWIRDPSNGGPYLYKKNMFKQSEKGLATTTGWATGVNPNNFRKFRFGHVILWLAECEAQVGSLDRATDLVNEIRSRAKDSNVVRFSDGTPAANYMVETYDDTFESKEFAMKAIQHETRMEFAMEGLRFFDLVRWGIAADVMNNYLSVEGTKMTHLSGKSFTAGKHERWPIPQTQRDLSVDETGATVLEQTPGY
ncbi:RagB/SusD family nutrient uptake outer membrane protein [uncultured Sunxiuqinia sp.]|uniref:RagB/SusD family nutrient uptake outer membrane protein n=1 Tax=uncultured Sunxiuqinia sp. TaxID=1573825 RepID=UPI002604013F|nr:RagB/SusD family nutrient uptake outer membrane protein [uncultured Sunxiuqinia sp.]